MYKIILSFRYLFKKRISYLALTAVSLSVFVVVVVMTVMAGLVQDFKQKNHQLVGDCVVATQSLVGFPYYEDFTRLLEKQDFVTAVSPVISSYGLIGVAGSEQNIGVEITGIDPVLHGRVTGFGGTLHFHRDDVSKAFEPAYNPHRPGCVVGVDLWLSRDARGGYSYNSQPSRTALSVTCFPLTAKGALAKAGTDIVNTKTFYFSDTSHTGLAKVDSSTIYLPLDQARMLCGMAGPVKRISRLYIKFRDGVKLDAGCAEVAKLWKRYAADRAGDKLAALLKTVTVRSWKGYRRQYIAPMEKEHTVVGVMFALVGLTTVFIVFVVFYMLVSHKSRDIGILKSIGVSQANIVGVFVLFAFWTGLLGSSVGVAAGAVFLRNINALESWLFEHFGFQLWDRTIYAIGAIPNRTDKALLAVVVVLATVACILSAALPSRQAAKRRPVEILQVSQL